MTLCDMFLAETTLASGRVVELETLQIRPTHLGLLGVPPKRTPDTSGTRKTGTPTHPLFSYSHTRLWATSTPEAAQETGIRGSF